MAHVIGFKGKGIMDSHAIGYKHRLKKIFVYWLTKVIHEL